MTQRVGDLMRSLPPSAAPVELIISRGQATRRRRAVAGAGTLVLAGLIAVAVLLLPRASQASIFPVTVPAGGVAGADGIFASGTADGHRWQLAVADISDPGYRCLPGITLNGTDADPVFPAAGSSATTTLGSANPGIGFAFVQLPGSAGGLAVNGGERVPAVTATVCGQRYHLAGFAYRLAASPRLTVASPSPGPSATATVPIPQASPLPQTTSQTAGIWNNMGSASSENFNVPLATGTIAGQHWIIRLLFSSGGDCYEFSGALSPNSSDTGACGPVSTPGGAETIMAMPLGLPQIGDGATGYAVQVSPATAHLRATLSDGHTQAVTPQVVAGRRYAAFVVPDALRLVRLTWLTASGQEIASTAALPQYGYTQFQP